jgi:hypothetical protein
MRNAERRNCRGGPACTRQAGLPCERLYRQLFNTELFLMAWGRIYANDGAMTPGINGETADGMSLAKIGRIIDALRHGGKPAATCTSTSLESRVH